MAIEEVIEKRSIIFDKPIDETEIKLLLRLICKSKNFSVEYTLTSEEFFCFDMGNSVETEKSKKVYLLGRFSKLADHVYFECLPSSKDPSKFEQIQFNYSERIQKILNDVQDFVNKYLSQRK